MGAGMRQWKALMRKNFINWKRQPKCSICEIACPCAVMFLMVILRNVIDVETYDFSALAKVRAPTAPGLQWNNLGEADYNSEGSWEYSSTVAENLTPFFEYAKYPTETFYILQDGYNLKNDVFSPLYFIPQQC